MISVHSFLLSYGLLALGILFTVRIVQTAKIALSGPLSTLPGPSLNKWTNLPLAWSRIRRRQVHYIHSLHEKYGPIVLVSPDFISFTSSETMKTIHKIGSEFRKGPFYEELQLTGTLVCLTNIKEHAARRKRFSKAFSQSNLLQWEGVIKKHAKSAVEGMKAAGRGGKKVDILTRLNEMASGIIGELVLGGEDADMIQVIHNELIVPSSDIAMSLPWYLQVVPRPIISWLLQQASTKEHATLTRESLQHIASGEKRHTLLTKVLEEGDPLPDDVVVREAKAFIVAGTDTTAITATYLIWQVLKHPEVKERLQQELSLLREDFSITEVQSLKYLQCVINETLRLNGSVSSSLPRITPKGGKNIGGHLIPEGTLVSTQAFTLHRSLEIFEDPWAFKPERWKNPTSEMKGALMPFGIGSRGCIGMQLAQMELALVAAVFFRECPNADVAASTRDGDMVAEDMFILSPKGHKCMIVFAMGNVRFGLI